MTEFFDRLNKMSDKELMAIANGKIPFFMSAKSATTREDVIAEAKAILHERQRKEKSWHEKPWGKIVIGVIVIVIAFVITFYVGRYLLRDQPQDRVQSPPTTPKPETKPQPGTPLPQTQPKASILQPAMTCFLEKHPTVKHLLIFTIKNEGTALAKVVSVDHVTMRYYWDEQKIKVITYGGSGMNKFEYNEAGRKWLFISELGPNKNLSGVTGYWGLPEKSMCVSILYFHTTFFTPENIPKEKNCFYFVEGEQLYTRNEYKKHRTPEEFSLIDRETQKTLKEDVANFQMPGEYKRQ